MNVHSSLIKLNNFGIIEKKWNKTIKFMLKIGNLDPDDVKGLPNNSETQFSLPKLVSQKKVDIDLLFDRHLLGVLGQWKSAKSDAIFRRNWSSFLPIYFHSTLAIYQPKWVECNFVF